MAATFDPSNIPEWYGKGNAFADTAHDALVAQSLVVQSLVNAILAWDRFLNHPCQQTEAEYWESRDRADESVRVKDAALDIHAQVWQSQRNHIKESEM